MKTLLFMAAMLATLSQAVRAQDSSCGIIWDAPILLSDTTHNAHSPQIALSGDDTVHVTWEGAPERLPYAGSMNGGASFIRRDILTDTTAIPFTVWNRIVAQGQRVFMFFKPPGSGGRPILMKRSLDGGTTWSSLHAIVDSVGELWSPAIATDTLSLVYSRAGIKHIARSTDGGQTWTRTNEGLNYFARIALSPGRLFLVQQTNGPVFETEYRISTDVGTTWSQTAILSDIDGFSSDLPSISSGGDGGDSIISVVWREAKYGCLTFWACGVAGRWSWNNGETFQPEVRYDEQPSGVDASSAMHGNTLAVIWTDDLDGLATLRLSRDRGQTWCPPYAVSAFGGGSPAIAVSRDAIHVAWFASDGQNLSTFRVFYRRGVFQTVDVTERNEGIPHPLHLEQNYPNPFNPSTTIRYTLTPTLSRWERASDGRIRVTLRVYDMLGREVATLVDEKKEPGEHTVEWNPSTSLPAGQAGSGQVLPSGVYYYRLIAGDRIETKKAVLIR